MKLIFFPEVRPVYHEIRPVPRLYKKGEQQTYSFNESAAALLDLDKSFRMQHLTDEKDKFSNNTKNLK